MSKKISQTATFLILLGVSVLALPSCSRFKKAGDDVVAIVNGFVIKKADSARMNRPLEDVINQELIFQKAKSEGYLEKDLAIRQVVAQQYVSSKFASEKPTVPELSSFYDTHKIKIDMVRVSQIVLPVKEGSALVVSKIVQDLKKSKTPTQLFPTYVSKYSQDKTSQLTQGDMGFFTFADKPETLSKVAFELPKVGDIAELTLDGQHHILMLVASKKGFDANRAVIQSQYRMQKSTSKQSEFLAELKKNAKVEVISR